MKVVKVEIIKLPPLIPRQKVGEFFPGLLSPKTLGKLASQGSGPPYYRIGGKAVYRAEDLLEWLERRATKVLIERGEE